MKETATPLPTGRVISSQSPTIPVFVNVVPVNFWINRMELVMPEAQVKEWADNGGDETPDKGLSREPAPLDKVEGNGMALHESVVEDLRKMMKKGKKAMLSKCRTPPRAGPRSRPPWRSRKSSKNTN